MLDGFLMEASELLKIHQGKVMERDKPVGGMHHEYFGNDACVDFVRLGLADVVPAHDRGFDGDQYTSVK